MTGLFNATATAVALSILSACADRYQEEKLSLEERELPQGIVEDFELVYSESVRPLKILQSDTTRVVAVLRAKRNENYENRSFPFQLFPKGIHMTFYDDQQLPTDIFADTAFYYPRTGIIDLRSQVKVITYDKKILKTAQLYWSRDHNWVFTERDFEFENPEEGTLMTGTGMEFMRDFSALEAMRTKGIVSLSETEN